MAAVEESVEIARSPEEVFAYLSELDKHGEWQDQIVSSRFETEGAWKHAKTTSESLAKELRLALQYPEGAAV